MYVHKNPKVDATLLYFLNAEEGFTDLKGDKLATKFLSLATKFSTCGIAVVTNPDIL